MPFVSSLEYSEMIESINDRSIVEMMIMMKIIVKIKFIDIYVNINTMYK